MTEPYILPSPSLTVYDLKNDTVSELRIGDRFEYPTVLCLGNFDGVHIGHRALIDRTSEIVKTLKASYPTIVSGAWFFSHTTKTYLNGTPCPELTTLQEKLALLKMLGADFAFVADFPSFRDLSAESFVCEILMNLCNCRFSVCGYDFRFGKKACGNAETLKAFFKDFCETVDCVKYDSIPAASSTVREYLYNGDVEAAAKMLGHPYSVTSAVVHGKQLGRTLGFPTANLIFPENKLIPKHGVYATLVKIKDLGKTYIGVSNVGKNPTVNDKNNVTCETYILDFSGDIYGKEICVEFHKMLREEKKFSSIDELTSAILKNADQARELLKNMI